MSVLIKGGRIVTAADDYVGDIFVEDGKVSLIGASLDVEADKVIDAGGKYVIPGAIDPHTHMEMPFGGTVSCDDSPRERLGGLRRHDDIVDFCLQQRPEPPRRARDVAREDRAGEARRGRRLPPRSHRSFGGGTLEDLARAPDEGFDYKLFMALRVRSWSTTRRSSRRWRFAAETGAIVWSTPRTATPSTCS